MESEAGTPGQIQHEQVQGPEQTGETPRQRLEAFLDGSEVRYNAAADSSALIISDYELKIASHRLAVGIEKASSGKGGRMLKPSRGLESEGAENLANLHKEQALAAARVAAIEETQRVRMSPASAESDVYIQACSVFEREIISAYTNKLQAEADPESGEVIDEVDTALSVQGDMKDIYFSRNKK